MASIPAKTKPGGAATQVQFNTANSFNAVPEYTWDDSTKTQYIGTGIIDPFAGPGAYTPTVQGTASGEDVSIAWGTDTNGFSVYLTGSVTTPNPANRFMYFGSNVTGQSSIFMTDNGKSTYMVRPDGSILIGMIDGGSPTRTNPWLAIQAGSNGQDTFNFTNDSASLRLQADGNLIFDGSFASFNFAGAFVTTSLSVGSTRSVSMYEGGTAPDYTLLTFTTVLSDSTNDPNKLWGLFTQNDNTNDTIGFNFQTGSATGVTKNSGGWKFKAGTATGTRGAFVIDCLRLDMSSSKIVNVTDPTSAQDASTKAYTDTKVASVGATAPIASTGGTTPNISISQSGVATDGYLSSTDWNTFNNKEPAVAKSRGRKTISAATTYPTIQTADNIHIIDFDVTTNGYDPNSQFSTTGGGTRFTVGTGKSGNYTVHARLQLDTSTKGSTERFDLYIYKNGAVWKQDINAFPAMGGYFYGFDISADIDLVATDYVEIFARAFTNDQAIYTGGGTENMSCFEVKKNVG